MHALADFSLVDMYDCFCAKYLLSKWKSSTVGVQGNVMNPIEILCQDQRNLVDSINCTELVHSAAVSSSSKSYNHWPW